MSWLIGTVPRIEQVIVNLMSNALKYAPGNEVLIELKTELPNAVIVVKDRGPGVPVSEHSRVFERFERAVSARNVSGLGLGLFISKGICGIAPGRDPARKRAWKRGTIHVTLPLFPKSP